MKHLRRYFILLWSSVLLAPTLTRADFHEAAESEGLGNKVIGALGDVAGKAGLTPTDDSHELVSYEDRRRKRRTRYQSETKNN